MERTPWTFDSILTISSKIKSGNGPLTPTFYKCLEEAQGIARSTLFGPVVRKEAVMGEFRSWPHITRSIQVFWNQGMLLLAAWSTNGWLPSGHAMRMALDLGLHRALDRLVDESAKKHSDEEERDLGMLYLVGFLQVLTSIQWFPPGSGCASTGLITSAFLAK